MIFTFLLSIKSAFLNLLLLEVSCLGIFQWTLCIKKIINYSKLKKNPNHYVEKDAITEKSKIPSKFFKDPLNPKPEVNLRRERERGPEN